MHEHQRGSGGNEAAGEISRPSASFRLGLALNGFGVAAQSEKRRPGEGCGLILVASWCEIEKTAQVLDGGFRVPGCLRGMLIEGVRPDLRLSRRGGQKRRRGGEWSGRVMLGFARHCAVPYFLERGRRLRGRFRLTAWHRIATPLCQVEQL